MSARDRLPSDRPPPPPHSLVAFVGAGARPGHELAEGLARDGVRALCFDRVEQALAAATHAHFDAAVLLLEGRMALAARSVDGWAHALGCPLLLLAELQDEVDEIIALELGADAVLPQPVSPRRLRAHLLRLLRRSAAELRAAAPAEPQPLPLAEGWALDRVHNRLQRGERGVDLTEMQAALMQVLLQDFGRVVPRARLLAAVSVRRTLQPRSVDVYIARLRLRLQHERVDDLRLEGVRGRGYRLASAPALASQAPLPALAWSHPATLRPAGAVGG